MKRLGAVLLGACMMLGFTIGGAAAQSYELKISHYLPPNHQIHQELTRWAAELGEKSQGRLKVSVFPAGQMGPITRQFDLARTGAADMAFFLHGALPGRFPLTEVSHLPYLFYPDGAAKPLSGAQASAIMTSLAPQFAAEHEGTRILYMINVPTVSLFFNKAVVHRPADMKGMRIRHNGPIASQMIELWGATPAAVAPAELADALQKGTVDGMTFNYEGAASFQYGPVTKSVTEIQAYGGTFALVMNSKKYDSLPADLQKLIDSTTGVDAARRVGGLYDQAEAAGRTYMLANKVEIVVPTPDEQKAFATPVLPLVDKTIAALEAKGLPARKVRDDIRARVNAKP
jgi:TRAP-type C4-dicarboxylate transport system substrate-binding protein